MQTNNPKVISYKNLRDAFYVYCDMIKRHGKGKEDTPIGSFYIGCVILSSFACEIGLKALLASENKTGKGHHLDKLFNELSPQRQDMIIKCTKLDKDTFNKSLSDNNNHFSEWRYYYEKNSLQANYKFIQNFFSTIKANIDTIKPEH